MSSQSNSELIRAKIGLMNGPRAAASDGLWNHPKLKELMPWALVRSYMIANASVPLMQTAQQQCEKLADKDEVAAGFASYLAAHIPEEVGHDEQCLEDLEVLGFSRDEVRARLPWPSIATLVGLQYYWILQRHPIALIAYLAIIEGNPVPQALIDDVQSKTGLPREAFRTLLWHTLHDPDHSADLYNVIDALPLTPEQMSLIGVNVAQTHKLIAQSVHEMIASFEERTRNAH